MVGDLDVSSTAGIVAGIGALTAIAVKYLEGWQRYEGRVDALQVAALTAAATPDATSAPDATGDPAVDAATPDPIPVVAAVPPPTPGKAANGTPPVAPSLP